MKNIVYEKLSQMNLGELKMFENLAVIPLFLNDGDGIEYFTLKDAMERGVLTVAEVSQGGHVPELKVINKAEIPVLLLDGEEVAGAKQNRVLNTTILLKEKSETVIPVSCTEHGRWSYSSSTFVDSCVVMSPQIRFKKARAVSRSLDCLASFRSDQSEVWDEVDKQAKILQVDSPTGAMKENFAARDKELGDYLKTFPLSSGQNGLLALINGEVIGFDLLPRKSAYAALHQKLLRSYALDAITQARKAQTTPTAEKARDFLKKASSCEGKGYPSVGYGTDWRFRGRDIVGSALVHMGSIIHSAFFALPSGEGAVDDGPFPNPRRRRDYRLGDWDL